MLHLIYILRNDNKNGMAFVTLHKVGSVIFSLMNEKRSNEALTSFI